MDPTSCALLRIARSADGSALSADFPRSFRRFAATERSPHLRHLSPTSTCLRQKVTASRREWIPVASARRSKADLGPPPASTRRSRTRRMPSSGPPSSAPVNTSTSSACARTLAPTRSISRARRGRSSGLTSAIWSSKPFRRRWRPRRRDDGRSFQRIACAFAIRRSVSFAFSSLQSSYKHQQYKLSNIDF